MSAIDQTHLEALEERAALVLAAAILRQAIMDVEQGYLRSQALAWLRGDGATLASFALDVRRGGWLRRIDELEGRYQGWERAKNGKRGGQTLAAAA